MTVSRANPSFPVTPLPWTRGDTLCLLLLAAFVGMLYWRVLTPNPADRAMLPSGDFSDQFYAFRLYEARAFAEGRLPLWSEDFNSGHPFLADIQSAVFYPPALVNTLLNAWLLRGGFSFFALELEAILHVWLAAAFTYLFARRVLKHRPGALLSGTVFALGGYLTSYPPLQLAILETAAWLPLVFFFLHRATESTWPHLSHIAQRSTLFSDNRQRTTRNLVFSGLTLGVAALAGHPQTFLFLLYACAAFFVYRVFWPESVMPSESDESRADLVRDSSAQGTRLGMTISAARRLAPFLLVLAIAGGIAAIQYLPAWEYQRLSTREAISYAEAGRGFATLDLLQFILPGFVSAFASPLYIGVLPLWLAVLAIAGRKNRDALFFALLAVGALLVAFGYYVFAYAVLYNIAPGFSLFRQEERLALVVSFSLALLAGFGLRALILQPASMRAAKRLWALLPMAALTAFLMLVAFYLAGLTKGTGRLAFLGDRAGLMVVLFLLATALAGAYLRAWLRPVVFAALAVAFVAFDLLSINEPANRAAPYNRYPLTPPIETAQAAQPFASAPGAAYFRVASEAGLPGHWGIAYGLEETGGISPLRLQAYDDLLQLRRERVWALLNVAYVFVEGGILPGTELAARDDGLALLRVRAPQPRAWVVHTVEVEPDAGRALERLGASDFDPQRTALLAAPATFPLSAGVGTSRAVFSRRDPEHLSVEVTAAGDGLLVLSENDYPGWRAWVDGVETPIVRADYALRGVPVRAGNHLVEMTYDPLTFKLGALLTGITLLPVLGALWAARGHD